MRIWKKLACLFLGAAVAVTAVGAENLRGGEWADAPSETRYVALTFDDGPTAGVTGALLEGLSARYVSATFFLCGYRVAQMPGLAQDIASDGHEIALHGCTHTFMNTMDASHIRKELDDGMELIADATGQIPRLFRPPGGLTNQGVLDESARLHLPIILWSLDPLDWNNHNVEAVVGKVVNKVKDGDIILMHDLSLSSVEAALTIIDRLQGQGYRFITVSELAQVRGVELEYGKKYGAFRP